MLLDAVGAVLAAAVPATPAVAAPAPVPCDAIGGGKYECSWWRPGDGRSAGAIVVRGGKVVGYLHQGRNWIVCQQKGAAVHNENGDRNHWYGWTQSDYGGWGWASALDAKGGDDYGPFAKAPSCDGANGPAPNVTGLWITRPPGGGAPPPASPPAGSPPARRPRPDTSCSSTRDKLSATASFRGHAHSLYQVRRWTPELRRRPEKKRIDSVSRRFAVGSVAISAAGCKRKGRWVPLGVPRVTVRSAGLDKQGKPKRIGALNYGLGVGVASYNLKSHRMVIEVERCAPDFWAQVRGFVELFDFGADMAKLRHPVAVGISITTYLAGQILPEGGVDCMRAGSFTYRVRATSRRLRLVLESARASDLPVQWRPVSSGGGVTTRQAILADVIPSPGRAPRRQRPGRQP